MNPYFLPPSGYDRLAFRRGRLLTLLVIIVTAGLFLAPAVRDVWFGYPLDRVPRHGENPWTDLVMNCAIIGILCSCAWRGGKNSTGCLAILYSAGLAAFVLTSVATLISFSWHAGEGIGFGFGRISVRGGDHDLRDMLAAAALGAWTVFSFWVLVLSRDARFYRDTRRLGIAEGDESFDDWDHRRPGGPSRP